MRDDLLDLAVDAGFAELPLPERHAEYWIDDIRAFMHNLRAALLRHPWSGALASSRPLLGPEALARSEFVYAALTRAGFSGAQLTAAAAAVTNLVIGSVAAEAAWQHDGEPAARQSAHEHLQAHAQDYPAMAEVFSHTSDWADHFSYSAEFLLVGFTKFAHSEQSHGTLS